jgi:HEAT repeat protein
VRELAANILEHVNQPWTFPLLVELLKDAPNSTPSTAANAIYDLNMKDKKHEILGEVIRICAVDSSDSYRIVASKLILSIGNIGGKEDIDPLLTLERKEPWPELKAEFQKALAKLGYLKSVREIENELLHSDGRGKVAAMEKVKYLNDTAWIPKVVPMLLDEEEGSAGHIGPANFRWKVCEHAIDLLRIIDPEKRITFPEVRPMNYSHEQLTQARQAYGLKTK